MTGFLGIGAGAHSGRGVSPLNILDVVYAQYRFDFGVTLGATPKATGTSPPPVTFGGLAAGLASPRIECTSPTQFRYSNGDTNWIETGVTIPSGSSYAPIGPTLFGMSFIFPAATYASDNIYRATASRIADQSGNGYHLVQATAAAQALFLASDPNHNGRPALIWDGVDDEYVAAMPIPAASTSPRHYWALIRQLGWGNGHCLWGSNGGLCQDLLQSSSSPNLTIYNGAGLLINPGAPMNTTKLCRALFTASASDRIYLGSSPTGSASAGNNTASDWHLGSGGGATFANFSAAEITISSPPSAGQVTALATYGTNLYGAAPFA